MTTLSNNNIAQAIYLASKGKSVDEQASISKQVVQFLARKKLLSKAPDILARLTNIQNAHEGRVMAKVSSIEKLSEKTKKEIEHALVKRYEGKSIMLQEVLNEKLLGGFKIEVNDEVIDLSIKNKVRKLQAYLTESI